MQKKILIVNKFYYNRGGDCVASMNLEQLLRANGHEVAVYAMQYPENTDSEFSKYFAPQISFSGGRHSHIVCRNSARFPPRRGAPQ